MDATTANTAGEADQVFSIEKLNEVRDLIASFTPKKAPKDMFLLNTFGGLRIIKNDLLPEGTIVVSEKLFDQLYESTAK